MVLQFPGHRLEGLIPLNLLLSFFRGRQNDLIYNYNPSELNGTYVQNILRYN
jgi:hypothetical protein